MRRRLFLKHAAITPAIRLADSWSSETATQLAGPKAVASPPPESERGRYHPEMIGWTLVANEETGPEKSLWLEADGKSRQFAESPQLAWAPDLNGRLFDPSRFLLSKYRMWIPGHGNDDSKMILIGVPK